jgi:hypothetical protein
MFVDLIKYVHTFNQLDEFDNFCDFKVIASSNLIAFVIFKNIFEKINLFYFKLIFFNRSTNVKNKFKKLNLKK